MACAICQTRRPRRFCPGVRGDICSLCCGTEREVSVDCPLDCEYLREAHKHEKPQVIDPETLPNRDLACSEEFLHENEFLLVFLASTLGKASMRIPGLVDFDMREALDAAVRTYRTLQSGLVYESLPANPLAADVCRTLLEAVDIFRKQEYERLGMHKTRESTVLRLLVFLQHFELSYNNGRRRGRAFIDSLMDYYQAEPEEAPPASSSLILP